MATGLREFELICEEKKSKVEMMTTITIIVKIRTTHRREKPHHSKLSALRA